MYKLVIIDDEKEQVEGIKTIIEWKKYDIEICGVAFNGQSGLKLIEEKLPDIAIIDIKMPLMGGLELIEEANKKNLNIQSIILSGYDDFHYAQKAIKLKTTNYLLKPCKPEEILQSVLRAKNNIIEEERKKNLLKNYQELIRKNIPILKEKLLTELIKGYITDNDLINKKILNYELNLSGPDKDYCIVLFSYDQPHHLNQEYNNDKNDYLTVAIRDMIKQSLKQDFFFEIFYFEENIVTIIEINKNENYLKVLLERLQKIKTSLNEQYDLSITIGIGKPVPSLTSIWKSYKQAETALETRFFSGENRIVIYEDKMAEENSNFLYPVQAEHSILLCLEKGEEYEVEKAVQEFFNNIYLEGKPSKKYIQKLSLTLLSNILHFCIDKNIEFKNVGLDILKTFDEISQSKTIVQLQDKIALILTNIIRELKANKNLNNIVQYAIDYIHENYQNNINLQMVADKINYSPSYLSLLFKQQTGTNFIDYLNKYRIEKAKKLLKDMSYKNYEVAYKVGYQDEKYFYQVFKRYTGLTASQYRDSINMFSKN